MEPIRTEEGKVAALKATTLNEFNTFSKTQVDLQLRKSHPLVQKLSSIREYLKRQATLCAMGNLPYAIRFQFSGINFLVLASLVFNFLDQVRLLIVNPKNDKIIGSFLVAIWFIMSVELICEICIRPTDYFNLMKSKDKYDPSIACFINKFHLVAESLALLCFFPEIISIFTNWEMGTPGSLLMASCSAVGLDHTLVESYLGLLTFAVIRLRVISLIRYWKTNWLNRTYNTFSEENDEFAGKKRLDLAETQNSIVKRATTVNQEEEKLKNAAHIGTALMITKSHRSVVLM